MNAPAGRVVTCPQCRGPAVFGPTNRWRPFCSERCRATDLGAWAEERYRVAAPPIAADDEPGEDDFHAPSPPKA